MSNIKISINDKTHVVTDSEQSVADLLKEAGCEVKDTVLVTPDGITHDNPEEMIRVSEGDHLEARPATGDQTIHYQVNGENQTTTSSQLTVGEILKHAGRPASIDVDDPASYYLENITTEQRYDDLDTKVDICEGDRFIAVHRGATPVA